MISVKLRELKEAKGITNREISAETNIPESTVTRILAGQTENPTFQNVVDIAKALGASLDELSGNVVQKSEDNNIVPLLSQMNERITELAIACDNVQKAAQVKDKWIIRMFVYCCVITFMLVACLSIHAFVL